MWHGNLSLILLTNIIATSTRLSTAHLTDLAGLKIGPVTSQNEHLTELTLSLSLSLIQQQTKVYDNADDVHANGQHCHRRSKIREGAYIDKTGNEHEPTPFLQVSASGASKIRLKVKRTPTTRITKNKWNQLMSPRDEARKGNRHRHCAACHAGTSPRCTWCYRRSRERTRSLSASELQPLVPPPFSQV